MDPTPSSEVERQFAELRERIGRLESALARNGIVIGEEPDPVQAVAAPLESRVANFEREPAALAGEDLSALPPNVAPHPDAMRDAGQEATPSLTSFGLQTEPATTRSLESRIASQWFNRIGIAAVLIGMAWFLKFAMDNHWIGPIGRVLTGLVAGAGLVAWSQQFYRRGYAVFSYSLTAVGSGTLYLSLWAAFSLYHLVPASVAFCAMIAVTAFNGFMAWVQDAELLALYAIVGALSTPLLLSTGGNHEVALFTYLLMMDIAMLVLTALRPWSRLLFSAFAGTQIFAAGWWWSFYTPEQASITAFFTICFFLLFAIAPRLLRMKTAEEEQARGWDLLVVVVMPIANAAVSFLTFYALINPASGSWAGAWLAVAMAAFYLLLLRLPARGIVRTAPKVLSHLYLTAVIVFLTLAIPLKTHGHWLTIGWLVEGAALLWVAARSRLQLLQALAMLCLVLGLGTLLVVSRFASATPIFNERFGTYCVAIAACAFAAWQANRVRMSGDDIADPGWTALAGAAALAVNALILLAVSLEIRSYWWFNRWHGNRIEFHNYQMDAQFTYSAWFMLFGALLLAAGFWRRSAFVRWQGLVLLAAAIGKVFLIDISELSQGYRILSFLGLGALLLGVSFVYQRDWLNLRHASPQEEHAGSAGEGERL